MSGPGITRRAIMGGFAGMTAIACAQRPSALRIADASARRRIDDLVASAMVPAAGLVISVSGQVVFAYAGGLAQGAAGEAAQLSFTPQTPMRTASVSKMATALAFHRLAASGQIDPEADIRGLFDPALSFPDFPDAPITAGHLLSHVSGLRDPDVYWAASPGRTEDLFTPHMWRSPVWGPPGQGFTYSNLGYGLAGSVLEQITGLRFDRLADREVLAPLGLQAGFNWAGVSPALRNLGATLYSREGAGGWTIRADGPAVLSSPQPAILLADGFRLEDYRVGTNGTLFSPQGGLRASLMDMIALVRASALDREMAMPVWEFDSRLPNGDDDKGYFGTYTRGCQVHRAAQSPLPGFELIGHHGEAYGLFSAAFHVPAMDAELAFAVTGTSDRGAARSARHPVMTEATLPLWAAAQDLLAAL